MAAYRLIRSKRLYMLDNRRTLIDSRAPIPRFYGTRGRAGLMVPSSLRRFNPPA
jgi:hypothetical protein